jgi:hypothetical protein
MCWCNSAFDMADGRMIDCDFDYKIAAVELQAMVDKKQYNELLQNGNTLLHYNTNH